ncbi:MAG: DNRLRE domain-containing protein, partial [Nanoarchaeota archaeon]
NFSGKPLYLGASADGIEMSLVLYNAERLKEMDVERAVLQFSVGQTCHSSYVLTYPKCGNDLTIEAHVVQFLWEQSIVTWASFHELPKLYNPTILGTTLLNVSEGEHRQYTVDVTTAVKAWISGKANYGIALIADEKGRKKGRLEQTDTVLDYAPELIVYTSHF